MHLATALVRLLQKLARNLNPTTSLITAFASSFQSRIYCYDQFIKNKHRIIDMRNIKQTIHRGKINPILLFLATFAYIPCAQAQVEFFSEDFTGPLDTGVWAQNGNANGHTGIEDGSYVMTAKHSEGGTKLVRFINGTAGSFRNEIEVDLKPFRLDANPGTQSDFKWKMFGPDGFMEIVLNSFGAMRMFHNDSDGGGGNIQPNTNIDITDGDRLKLVYEYDIETDEITVTYALNDDPEIPFYSGGGIDGPIGDIITNFVEVENFKWGNDQAAEIITEIDSWNLVDPLVDPVDPSEPEPLVITEIDYDPVADTFRFTWDSEPGKVYGINWGFDLTTWDFDISDDIASQGTTTTYPALEEPAAPNPGATPDGPPRVIFFRVEEQPAP